MKYALVDTVDTFNPKVPLYFSREGDLGEKVSTVSTVSIHHPTSLLAPAIQSLCRQGTSRVFKSFIIPER